MRQWLDLRGWNKNFRGWNYSGQISDHARQVRLMVKTRIQRLGVYRLVERNSEMDARVNEWNFKTWTGRFQGCTKKVGGGTNNCVVVVESSVGSEFRAFGGVRGSIHVLVYDAVDAGTVMNLAYRTTSYSL
jgi:hypothetical protein